MRKIFLLTVFISFICPFSEAQNPKNIILFIGDGMGYNQIQACNYYYGVKKQKYQKFDVKLWVSTYPYGWFYNTDSVWSDNGFLFLTKKYTDSAPAATAMATGHKTNDAVIGLDSSNSIPANGNIAEYAKKYEKSVGIITTVPFDHATPAAFASYTKSRNNFFDIAYQMLVKSRVDVIRGSGNPEWDDKGNKNDTICKYYFPHDLWNAVKNDSVNLPYWGTYMPLQSCDDDTIPDPWFLIQKKQEFKDLAEGRLSKKRILGIQQVCETLRYDSTGDNKKSDILPSLSLMSIAALNVLKGNNKGFLMIVEGGIIDWACHSGNKYGMIKEVNGLNNAVDSVLKWLKKENLLKETLIIVTADHETGFLTGADFDKTKPLDLKSLSLKGKGKGKGNIPDMKFNSQVSEKSSFNTHTNQLVPIYAKGPGSKLFYNYANEKDKVRGKYLQNNEIGLAIFKLLTP